MSLELCDYNQRPKPDKKSVHYCTGNQCQLTSTEVVIITCKFCSSTNVVKYGKKDGVQYYLCYDCRHTFAWNNCLIGMRYPPDQIATAINLYYDGLSIDAIRRQFDKLYNVYPSDSTIYEWIVRFVKEATEKVKITNIHVGNTWIADETVLKIDEGKDVWFWDILDSDTRYLLASHMSKTRTTKDAQSLMLKALSVADKAPQTIITDKLYAYLDGIELVFGGDTEHIRSKGFRVEPNTNLIERFHGTLKARTKVMRGLRNIQTARIIMDGWLIHYNFFRPHEALNNKTPAEVAKADFPYKSWLELISATDR